MIEQPTFAPATDRLRRAYGFDEVALVPGAITVDPAEVDLTTEVGDIGSRSPSSHRPWMPSRTPISPRA